jgi:ATP-dependent Clp protease ATP-binding subunit ClpC
MRRLFRGKRADRDLSQRAATHILGEIGLLQAASREAKRLNHEYIGSEHVLLALVGSRGSGGRVLEEAGVSLERATAAVAELVRPGPEMVTCGRLPVTPAMGRIVKLAVEHARARNAPAPDELDLLFGVICEERSVAFQVLGELGLDWKALRERLVRRGDGPQ